MPLHAAAKGGHLEARDQLVQESGPWKARFEEGLSISNSGSARLSGSWNLDFMFCEKII